MIQAGIQAAAKMAERSGVDMDTTESSDKAERRTLH
jgi:hypothetical protein